MKSVLGLPEPSAYTRHVLHADEQAWPETNCYVDLWIEMLHGARLDPMAAMAFTLELDFEGDQYTFFKVSHADLRTLYGIEVQELNLWKPIATHALEQTAQGRLLMPEISSFYLPDTAGVSYRTEHAKSSIAIDAIDIEARVLRYFHGRSYYELSGEDFDGALRTGSHPPTPEMLPPFGEIAKLDRMFRLSVPELTERAVELTRAHLGRRPASNPVAKHRAVFAKDLEWLKKEPSMFHLYAFATVRQAGSCYATTASYLRWLEANGQAGLEPAAAAFDAISTNAKMTQFKLARMAVGRDANVDPLLEAMENAWDEGMSRLVDYYGD
jgi:hypothetical protein